MKTENVCTDEEWIDRLWLAYLAMKNSLVTDTKTGKTSGLFTLQ
jgi:hypothetical protein